MVYFDSLGGGPTIAARLMQFMNRVLRKRALDKIYLTLFRRSVIGKHVLIVGYIYVLCLHGCNGIERNFTPRTENVWGI